MRRALVLLVAYLLLVAGPPGPESASSSPQPDRSILHPGFLLVSDGGGQLFVFDLQRNVLEPSTIPIGSPLGGETFDIQYRSPFEIVIANNGGPPRNPSDAHLDEFNLLTRELTTVASGLGAGGAVGVAVSPRGIYYFTCVRAGLGVRSFNRRTGAVEVIATESFAGITLDRQGRLLVTGGGRLSRIEPNTHAVEVLVELPGYALNGIVFTSRGTVLVVSSNPAAIFEIDPSTRQATTLYEGAPLRYPEDVDVDAHGNIYIVDSDVGSEPKDFLPGIYVLRPGATALEALHTGAPLGDIVDVLVTPFRGFR